MNQKEYYYKGNKLYNIKKIEGLNYNWHDLQANWKDKGKEKLGNFYLEDLEIKNLTKRYEPNRI